MDRFQFEGDQKELIKPLLKGWHDTLDEIEGVNKWGLPYVYGERTNVGILAMAAMKEGYLSFEEYSCKNAHADSRDDCVTRDWVCHFACARSSPPTPAPSCIGLLSRHRA